MKKFSLIMVSALLITRPILSANLSEVEISAKRTTLDQSKDRSNNTTTTTKEIAYELKIESKTFQVIPKLEIKYMVFYSDAKAGSKGEEVLASVKGVESITNLPARGKVTLQTKPISLSTEELDGGFFYTDGSSNRARDTVRGVWVRAYSGGKLVGEYMNPTTLGKKYDWKE